MPNPFYIWNPATKFVIDIAEGGSGAKPTAGRMLDAYTKKTSAPQNANQLWTYVPVTAAGFENAFLLQNPWTELFIEINQKNVAMTGPMPPGTPLDANNELPPTGPGGRDIGGPTNANQLWGFVPDPNGSGNYFIQNVWYGLVIDIREGGLKLDQLPPGTPLDAFTMKNNSPENMNQLWTLVDPSGNHVTVPPPWSRTIAGVGR